VQAKITTGLKSRKWKLLFRAESVLNELARHLVSDGRLYPLAYACGSP